MKISKVDHAKTAVNGIKNDEGRGFLYVDPSLEKPVDLVERFNELQEKAEKLYSVFIPYQIRGKASVKERAQLQIYNNCKKAMNRAIKEGCSCASVKNLGRNDSKPHNVEEMIEFLYSKLKNSLKSRDKRAVWDDLFNHFLTGEPIKSNDKELELFAEWINDDRSHSKTAGTVKKSIQNQNMPVQPDGDRLTLCENTNRSPKKLQLDVLEKQALEEFLREYAVIDKEERERKLKKIRSLIHLFFYEDGISDEDIEDVWQDHEKCRNNDNSFLTNFTLGKITSQGLDKHNELIELLDKECKLTDSNDYKKYELKEIKKRKRELIREIKDCIRFEYIRRYRNCMEIVKADCSGKYFESTAWNRMFIHMFEKEVETLFRNFTAGKEFQLHVGYVAEKIWKQFINYMSIKYIALGKALYHFGCEDLEKSKDNSAMSFGTVNIGGISSFDYEAIKAEETLQRNMAVYVALAVANFSQAAIKNDYRKKVESDKKTFEDVLLYKAEQIHDGKNDYAVRNILQYWGGQSKWNELWDELDFSNDEEVINDIKEMLYGLRNISFHFETGVKDSMVWNQDRVLKMLKREISFHNDIRRTRFYSNNLHLFYSQDKLRKIVDSIYAETDIRGAFIPSYKNVLGRKSFDKFLDDLGIRINREIVEEKENVSKWKSGLYFLFKEIYYRKFLYENDLKERFYNSLKQDFDIISSKARAIEKALTKDEKAIIKEKKAIKNFKDRIDKLIDNYDFEEICQMIMTETNMQNSDKRNVQSSKDKVNDKKIFEHYRMLLYKELNSAFGKYIKENYFSIVAAPEYKNEFVDIEDFLPDWKTKEYDYLLEKMKDNTLLQSMYICAKFLAPKQINELAGVFKHYMQYCSDIRRRAEENENTILLEQRLSDEECKSVIELVEFCGNVSGVYTNVFEDYFDNEEAYKKYLSNYVDLNDIEKKQNNKKNLWAEKRKKDNRYKNKNSGFLGSDFGCLKDLKLDGAEEPDIQKITDKERDVLEIYVDKKNPIINRNVLMAKLYAPEMVLRSSIELIKYKELMDYYDKRDELPDSYRNGNVRTQNEQRKICEFRDCKNRVELLNLYEYAEIINELMGQLINWSYMRERDLMYFMLGFHYMCLQNNSPKPDNYDSITKINNNKSENIILNGAVLYQILAVYIYGHKMYDNDGKIINTKKMSLSAKINKFAGEKCYGRDTWEAGQELFQVMSEEGEVNELRNYIDHFKYYINGDRSMMDLYSEIFDRFFIYDMKYKKNVINIFENILKRHFVLVDGIKLSTGSKHTHCGKKQKEMALITFDELKSDSFTYKEEGQRTYSLDAKGKMFLTELKKVLNYKNV